MKTFAPVAGILALGLIVLVRIAGGGRPAAATATPPPAAGASEGPARTFELPANSPKWKWLEIEPARLPEDQIVAVLPAQVTLDEDRSVRVSTPVSGRVVSLDARPGDFVRAGAALAHLVSGDVGQAQSDRDKAAAAAAQSRSALERTRDLYAHHVVSLRELQQAEADEAQARAEAERAGARAHTLGAAGDVDQVFVLRAPIPGRVLERHANVGAEIRPDAPDPLFVLSDLGRVWLVASLYPRDLGRVHRGDRMRFRCPSAPDREFESRVDWVSDALDPQTHTATVRATIENPDGALRAEMPGEARLYSTDFPGHPVVPTRALVTHGRDTEVIVEAAPGRFERRVVRVGQDDGETTTLLDGLRAGERVVTRGSLLLAAEMDEGP